MMQNAAVIALRSVARSLTVLYNAVHTADLQELGDKTLQLQYRPEIIAASAGQRVLSIRLPVQAEPFPDNVVRPFLEGYLPEGDIRRRLGQKFRLADDDVFGLLTEIGRDCAGALSFVPEVDVVQKPGQDSVLWLDEAKLEDLINELPINPLADDPRENVRLSLAGAQDKMAVIVDEDGRYGLPRGPMPPTTHILKPEPALRTRSGKPRFPDLVENEAYCMHLAGNVGISVAHTVVLNIGGQPVLLVTRYDRRVNDAVIERIHQEDACQALGIPPHRKYEEHGGPSVADVLNLLREASTSQASDLLEFVDRTAFNYLVGNCDAHGKNVSLVHSPTGLTLSPAYDLVCTVVYTSLENRLAMAIGGQFQADQVTARHWLQQLEQSGLNTAGMRRRLARFAERALSQLKPTREQAQAEGFDNPMLSKIEEYVRHRAEALRQLA